VSILGAVVVGAGQAGLATSYHLARLGIEHVVLERGRIGETWLSQRWDTFALNTPGWRSHLREDDPDRRADDDAFLSAPGFVDRLETVVRRHDIRVTTGTEVTAVAPAGRAGEGFVVSVRGTADGAELRATDELRARSVVVASGIQNVPRIPRIATELPAGLSQVATADYRNPAQLPPGAVLVVGGAQSGVQIAEDLVAGGRTVYLCTSKVGRSPRRHRGRDIFAWLGEAGWLDQTPEQLPDPQMIRWAQPQVSGVGPLGHTVSLQSLAALGVGLLGRPTSVKGQRLLLDDSLGANIAFGDRVSAELKGIADRFIGASGVEPPPVEPDPADEPHPDPSAVHSPAHLDLEAAGIASVVWATGFRGAFGYLPGAALDERGVPAHARGVGFMPGVFVVGFPWLTKRRSGIIPGVDEDAARIARLVAERSTGR
jgi:putative flavoprotein involved in K+ transport